ncbi:ABC transporter permease [Kibdelosporangium philippinense]|uniref:Transport permease protein n=1 Tax=Kibdelosporangium philippinense TaxID=211113 RepID=A0ABS8ZQM1_9PSEU|nr:ABC transporter permease [Kibdelosporangium philippinense]MCE7009220.1 ABC transporter permease [Kibdelosporangium philippinense]
MTTIPTTVTPFQALRQGFLLAGRSFTKLLKNPTELIGLIVQPVIMLILFVFVLGGAISGGNREAYVQQLVPGLMVYTTLLVSLGTGVALCTDVTGGVFDRFRSMPIARSAPLIGAVLGDLPRYAFSVALTLGFGFLVGFEVQTNPFAVLLDLLLMVLFALSLCWISVWIGLVVKSPQTVPNVLFLFIMPLSFGSSIFVSGTTMPGWLQAVTEVNPASFMTEVNRGLLHGGPVAGPLLGGLAWMVGLIAVFYPLAMVAYRRRMR